MNDEREKGKVKFFSKSRFFGFIGREGEEDVFFHGSNVLEEKDLEQDEEVSFEIEEKEKGLQAVKVERITEEEPEEEPEE